MMMKSLKAYKNNCRCCLQLIDNRPNSIKLTDEIFSQYFELLNLEITKELISLPIKNICLRCHYNIIEYTKFRRELLETHVKLVDALKNDQTDEAIINAEEILNKNDIATEKTHNDKSNIKREHANKE
jgi:hypothetical protein